MSRPQEPHRAFFPFGNPFRRISPKNSQISSELLSLLNSFEKTLSERMRKLNPIDKSDVLSFSWMKLAMESISETYRDIITLIADLELPVSDWDEKWIDAYLDVSVKLLDMSVIFNSELSRLNQGNLYLKCAAHNLESVSPHQLTRTCSSLDGWRSHMGTKNPRFGNCWTILESLVQSLDHPKVKNSAKGKILMRAMYGVKVETVFVYSVFAAAFSGSAERLFNLNLRVAETYLWAESFKDLQANVNSAVRKISQKGRPIVPKELEAVDGTVKRLYPMIREGVDSEHEAALQSSVADLRSQAEKFSMGIDVLTKEVNGYFTTVMDGRDELLKNLRGCDGGKAVPKMAGTLGLASR